MRCWCLLLLVCSPWLGADELSKANKPTDSVFRVGVLANYGVKEATDRWQPTMDYLSGYLPGSRFEVEPLDSDELGKSLKELQIHFIITNPSQYLNLSQKQPLSWLATMRSDKHNGATYAIGSAILVRHDSPVYNLEQLRGSRVVASSRQALGGYQAAMGLLQRRGEDAFGYFAETRFIGFPLENLLYRVRDGVVDAAITPFCTLEELAQQGVVKRADFRVINGVRPEGYECETSTSLYPNWSFAASDQVPARITQQVTKALFELSANSEVAIKARTQGWTSPISQLNVIKLHDELSSNARQNQPLSVALDWFRAHWEYAFTVVLILLSGMCYHLWLEYRFRQKSERLLATERSLRDKELMLERMQSAAVLGEIGAGLAHELNQPIAAITQYSEGGLQGLKYRGQESGPESALLLKIHTQSLRAGAVVHRIRGLLRRQGGESELIVLPELVKDTVLLLEREASNLGVVIQQRIVGVPRPLLGDSVALSQLLVNLIKNALDALKAVPTPRQLHIRVSYQADAVHLLLADNGYGLMLDEAEVLSSFVSTKADGLGLGLAICRDVVARHGGKLSIGNIVPEDGLPWSRGCVVQVRLPNSRQGQGGVPTELSSA